MPPPLRDPYATPPDFQQLAEAVPAFAPFLRQAANGRGSIDWKADEAVRALASALLQRDFGLKVELPEDRLCPTVPSRLEYVLFVLRLALLTSDARSSSSTPALVGLDIGTGASCIYPLLAVRTLAPTASGAFSASPAPLRMLATDIDARSLSFAKRNVELNELEERIRLFEVEQAGAIFPKEVVDSVERIDFTMCNPPFYSSDDEMASSLAAKELEPFAVCTGASNELLTPGGEVAFVSRMVEESVQLRQLGRIRWFTSLLGKFSSISPLAELLKAKKIGNYAVTPLPPQGQTTRWVIAWSLQDYRFPPELLYPSPFSLPSASSQLPSPLPLAPAPTPANSQTQPTTRFLSPSLLPSSYYVPIPSFPFDPAPTVASTRQTLESVLADLGAARTEEGETAPLSWTCRSLQADEEKGEGEELLIRARKNVWSRSARRAAARVAGSKASGEADDRGKEHGKAEEKEAMALELRLLILLSPPTPAPSSSSSASATPASPVGEEKGEVEATRQVLLRSTWVRGCDEDRTAYVGLWGYLVRKVGEAVRGTATPATERKQEDEGEEGRRKKRKVDGADGGKT